MFDAALYIVAAGDFLDGRASAPADRRLAEREDGYESGSRDVYQDGGDGYIGTRQGLTGAIVT